VNARRSGKSLTLSPISEASSLGDRGILDAEAFRRMIALERKRSERSRKPFMLLLLDMGEHRLSDKNGKVLGKILSALSVSTRETDITGWYANDCVVGVMFTEIAADDGSSPSTIIARVTETLQSNLTLEQFNRVNISFHVFPEDWDHDTQEPQSNPTLYPDLSKREDARKSARALKRMMDVAGSMLALMFFSPIVLIISCAIKATSKGPVFFPATSHRPTWQTVCVSEIPLDVRGQRCRSPQRVRQTADCG